MNTEEKLESLKIAISELLEEIKYSHNIDLDHTIGAGTRRALIKLRAEMGIDENE